MRKPPKSTTTQLYNRLQGTLSSKCSCSINRSPLCNEPTRTYTAHTLRKLITTQGPLAKGSQWSNTPQNRRTQEYPPTYPFLLYKGPKKGDIYVILTLVELDHALKLLSCNTA